MRTILITGFGRFPGSPVIDDLVRAGEAVVLATIPLTRRQ
jgi:hypothetical protein